MKFVQAKHFYSGGNVPRIVVIHDMEYPEKPDSAEWCANFFAAESAPLASAHYAVDGDSVVQMVKEDDGAWHTPGLLVGREINRTSIGVEHAGFARQTPEEWQDPYSAAMLELSAQLVADICARHNIPPRRLTVEELQAGVGGICGHADCTTATGTGSHWDPGPGFPWDWYMERVLAHYGTTRLPPVSSTGWPRVTVGGVTYEVAPEYIWPIGIGEAEDMAKAAGCELPSPELVDAIWQAADAKIDGAKMIRTRTDGNDGTPQTMASEATFNAQADRLVDEVVALSKAGVKMPYTLAAGYCKDVVKKDGVLGIYGWQRADGSVIQPLYTGHARGWIDYSQGLRYVRKVTS